MSVPPAPQVPPSRRLLVLWLCLFALLWFGTLHQRKLIRPDEGRYAEIAREMAASGDWITPRLNGYKYFEKPALQYWATAAAFTLFGVHDWAARLWPALTGFLGVLLVFHFGHRAIGPPAGALAAVVLAGSGLWIALGHFNSLDMGVSFFMTLAVLGFALAQRDDATRGEYLFWSHAAWAGAALAVLSKGLIGIVLPAGAIALYILVQRDWARLRRLALPTGLALFLVVTVPWFVAVSLANEEFFRFFFIHEHVERFLTRAHGRYEPAWYFLPVLALGVTPWLVALAPALAQGWRAAPERRFQPARFLLGWVLLVFAFFSASSSKLPSYILPIFPALAVLVGAYLAQAPRILPLVQALAYAVAGGLLALLLPAVLDPADTGLPAEILAGYMPWIVAAGVALLGAGLCAAWLELRRRRRYAVLALAAGGLAFTTALLLGHETLASASSAHGLAQTLRPVLRDEVPVYSVNLFDHTLPYYLGRPVTMVVLQDELAQSIAWEPRDFIPDYDAFARAWRARPAAWAVFRAEDFPQLPDSLGLAYEIAGRDLRRVLVKKP